MLKFHKKRKKVQIKAVDLDGKSYNKILFMITMLIGSFCIILSQTILVTAYPSLMETFNISFSTVEWLTTGFLLINGIVIPFSAIIMNKFSSKYIFIITMIIFFLGNLLSGLAPNFFVLALGRAIQAVAVGILVPLLQSSFLHIFNKEERGSAMGIVGLVIALAPSIGPTLSGLIIANLNWRWLFLILLPILFIDIIAAFFFAKKVIPLKESHFDILSGLLSILGFGGILYGFSIAGTFGWLNWLTLTCIILALIIIIIFCFRQNHLSFPFLRISILKYPMFVMATLIGSTAFMSMVAYETILPAFVQKVLGQTTLDSGLVLLPGALIIAVLNPITGKIYDKRGIKNLAIIGLIILCLGNAYFVFLSKKSPQITIVFMYFLRLTAVSMLLMPSTTASINALPNEYISDGTAINNTLRQIIASLGIAIMVSLLAYFRISSMPKPEAAILPDYQNLVIAAEVNGYRAAFAASFIFSFLGLILALFLKNDKGVGK